VRCEVFVGEKEEEEEEERKSWIMREVMTNECKQMKKIHQSLATGKNDPFQTHYSLAGKKEMCAAANT
jgi:hypothetical protein